MSTFYEAPMPEDFHYHKVQHPYDYKFARMNNPGIRRNDPIKKRIRLYMLGQNMTQLQFVEKCNFYAKQYGSKFTIYDLGNYLYSDVSPKIDKLTAIARVLHVDIVDLCGYGPRTHRKS